MLSVLLRSNIDAQKVRIKGDLVELVVDEKSMATAIDVLRRHGLPRDVFSSIDTMFPKDGLISSPLAERARFVYAVSQELSQTISLIDGVIDSRVHVVIPAAKKSRDLGEVVPATASVFVRFRAGTRLKESIPQIRSLVSTGVEGLNYKNVNVVLFEVGADQTSDAQHGEKSSSSYFNQQGDVSRDILLVFAFLMVIFLGTSLWLVRSKLLKRDVSGEEHIAPSVTEDTE